jgi:hypothetical protein
MSNKKSKNSFFGLNFSEKTKIIKKAADKATAEQLSVVKRHGGIKALRSYSRYSD